MVEGRKTQGGANIFHRNGDVACAVGDCPRNKVGGGMICAGVVELRHLFGVKEGGNVCESVP